MSDIDTAWKRLETEGARLRGIHLRELFAADPGRSGAFTATLDDLSIDFSKEKIDQGAFSALLGLAEATGVASCREALFSGAPINLTEGRAVQHMALRAPEGAVVEIDGADVMPEVRATLDRFLAFAEDVRSGAYAAADGPFTDVINIGIGGSDLGPVMATRALRPDHDGPRLHFVSNVDGGHIADVTATLDPKRTLVIVASKTFTTLETMANADTARAWLSAALGDGAGAHMAAVSTNLEATAAYGIDASRVFGFWDWVGGRYSLWSAIGLPVAIAVGAQAFRAFLAGAAAMDAHFREAPLAHNLPVLLALIGVWRRNVMGWRTVGLIPYDQRLERFPAYVQQLDMESNGKSVTREGRPAGATGPVIWGEPGTNAQHSFFQLIHQGADTVPVDFIAAATPRGADQHHHELLLANCLAQGQALAFGKSEAEVRADMEAEGKSAAEIEMIAPHRVFPGDRPTTTILHRALTPYALGRLVALYEHKVFVQGAIWNVNSYDQWGVELGKVLAKALIPAVKGEALPEGLDGSTAGLIARIHDLKG
ncbi:glucose-6-phosphate isomerase [Paroceanicella profunda]|uniref:Glucose-6-phosphate isomerase n=1 Tax=Paroceanicella profunda TaxID=2579971 RepID=A0A5B8FGZ5_9RHOB|nr:glucose-6-phosphate isomerase [Paroceanicella profunda]QDL91418.1 glucose-6-phosphate isomerase [Paroceanicella profunda]